MRLLADQDWLTFHPLHEDAEMPARATEGSAGYDIKAYLKRRIVKVRQPNNEELEVDANEGLTLMPGERAMVPCGFKMKVPSGFEAEIRPRSGTAYKVGLTLVNSPGTVDADFADEWMILMINLSSVPCTIAHGERIAQMLVRPFEVFDIALGEVKRTTDRAGGFGSTGK